MSSRDIATGPVEVRGRCSKCYKSLVSHRDYRFPSTIYIASLAINLSSVCRRAVEQSRTAIGSFFSIYIRANLPPLCKTFAFSRCNFICSSAENYLVYLTVEFSRCIFVSFDSLVCSINCSIFATLFPREIENF